MAKSFSYDRPTLTGHCHSQSAAPVRGRALMALDNDSCPPWQGHTQESHCPKPSVLHLLLFPTTPAASPPLGRRLPGMLGDMSPKPRPVGHPHLSPPVTGLLLTAASDIMTLHTPGFLPPIQLLLSAVSSQELICVSQNHMLKAKAPVLRTRLMWKSEVPTAGPGATGLGSS